MDIQQQGDGWMLNNTIYIGTEDKGLVNLRLEKGPYMHYDTTPSSYIDFPGEYDTHGVTIMCVEANGKLSYIVNTNNETIALLQNVAVLEVASFDAIDTWVCAEEAIKQEIENLELEGDIIVLEKK